MKTKFIFMLLLGLFLISFVSAWNFGNKDFKLMNWTQYTTYQNVTNYTETDPVWIADKGDYYTSAQVDDINTSMKNYVLYVNSTNGVGGAGSYEDSWINGTIDNKIEVQNTSLVNWVNSVFVTIASLVDKVGNWSADKADYTTLAVLNNGSYLNPASTDTFIGNYSTFLTHITYDDVMNGTLKDYFDGLYIGIGTETETKWNANYSAFLTHVTSATLNNGSYLNQDWLLKSQWNATNTSYALLTQLNNGSYLNYAWNSTNTSYLEIKNWNATNNSYMEGSNFTIQNTSMKNYITSVNTSMDNLVDLNNASITNALNTKRDTTNYTLAGNVNITNSNMTIGVGNFICLNYGCTQWIKANSTGVFIKG